MLQDGATIQHHMQIWHCPTEEEEAFPSMPHFPEDKTLSQKLPRRIPVMYFGIEQGHMPTSKTITGNRMVPPWMASIAHHFPLSHTAEGQTPGQHWDSASEEEGRMARPSTVLALWCPQRSGLIPSKTNSCNFSKEFLLIREKLWQILLRKLHRDLIG